MKHDIERLSNNLSILTKRLASVKVFTKNESTIREVFSTHLFSDKKLTRKLNNSPSLSSLVKGIAYGFNEQWCNSDKAEEMPFKRPRNLYVLFNGFECHSDSEWGTLMYDATVALNMGCVVIKFKVSLTRDMIVPSSPLTVQGITHIQIGDESVCDILSKELDKKLSITDKEVYPLVIALESIVCSYLENVGEVDCSSEISIPFSKHILNEIEISSFEENSETIKSLESRNISQIHEMLVDEMDRSFIGEEVYTEEVVSLIRSKL